MHSRMLGIAAVVSFATFLCAGAANGQPSSYQIVDVGVGSSGCGYNTPLINPAGQAIITAQGSGGSDPFLVDTGGTRIDMGSLFGFGATAWGINASAQVIGTAAIDSLGDRYHPFFWSTQTGMIDLTPDASSSSFPVACGINNQGDIVGGINNRGFFYTGGQMYDLNSLTIDGLSNWDNLGIATGINDNGEILGNGSIQGSMHNFILVPSSGSSNLLTESDSSAGLTIAGQNQKHKGSGGFRR